MTKPGHTFLHKIHFGQFLMLFTRQESIFHKYVFALLVILIQPGWQTLKYCLCNPCSTTNNEKRPKDNYWKAVLCDKTNSLCLPKHLQLLDMTVRDVFIVIRKW